MNRCKATRKNGQPCGAYAIADGDYCFTHSPEHKGQRQDAHQKGGKNRKRQRILKPFPMCDPKTVQGLGQFLEVVMQGAWSQDIQPPLARTLGYLAQVQKGVIEAGELEARVKHLEEIIAAEGHK